RRPPPLHHPRRLQHHRPQSRQNNRIRHTRRPPQTRRPLQPPLEFPDHRRPDLLLMRIAIISTLTRPVPPPAEGSVELLVSHLTEFLVRRGHDVTLFALPESKTSARLISPV